jgi:hypothetical protein
MARIATLMFGAGVLGAAIALIAAASPSALGQAQPGLWEISGAPGNSAPVRQCVGDVATLARFEHRASSCSARVLKDGGSSTAIDYSCGGAGFGHSEIDVITPRSLRISTQGISGGLPFNYVLQARRVDDCPKVTATVRH